MITSPVHSRIGSALLSILFVALVSFGPVIPGTIRHAHALGADLSFEVNPAVVGGIVTQTTISQVLNGIAWTVAKTAIQSLTRSTVNWINSGFDGSPAFITDLNQNLQSLSDAVADDFFSALERNVGVDVRSPFQDQITQLLRDNYYRSTAGFYGGGYNLNSYSDNPDAFLNGQFGYGGFDAWFATLSNDQNNPLGAYHALQGQLYSSVENARVNRLNELNWGNGFLSWRGDCTAAEHADGTINGGSDPVSLGKTDKCLQYDIKTPGSVIESTLGITATSPLRQLELADSINEIVGALATQLVGQMLGGNGLSGVSQPSAGGGTSSLTRATDPSQYLANGSSLATAFIQTVATAQSDTSTYQSNWQKIQTAAQQCNNGETLAETTLTTANAALAKAATATSALTSISAKITAAQSSTNSASSLNTISSEYQSLISSGTLLSYQDISNAQTQASDTNNGDSESLYQQLTQLCGSGR